MIKKLQWKFIAVIMTIVTTILALVFATVFVSTKASLENESKNMLRQALMNKNMKKRPGQPLSPFVFVVYYIDGDISMSSEGLLNIKDENIIKEITDIAIGSSDEYGKISNYSLRFLKQKTIMGYKIAFADTSSETAVTNRYIKNAVLIWLISLAVFFMISLSLSYWMTKPVKEAWDEQLRFTSDASHELKTPLTVILANADMALSNINDEDIYVKKRLGHIKAESVRMKKLTEELLYLARSDNNVDNKTYSDADISDIITDTVLMFEPLIYENGKTLIYNIEENITVRSDTDDIRQLTEIFLDNALKYSNEGGTINVNLTRAGKTAHLTVSNTGEPIEEKDMKRLFDRFYRADTARQNNGGYGLGLSIASVIIKKLNAKISLESKNGLNTFCISIPMTKGASLQKQIL